MPTEIGTAREEWGRNVWLMAEDFANHMKSEERPFYIVYACKEDKPQSKRLGYPVFKQAIKAYYERPPAILGILVWYVDNKRGIFEFKPELSAPFDVPVDPKLLSTDSKDLSARVAEQGEKLKVVNS